MAKLKALTVQQPWVWAVLEKKIDFFMEPFPPKQRGYFLIHSGIGWNFEMENWLRDQGILVPDSLTKTALMGYANLINVTTKRMRGSQPAQAGFVFQLADVGKIQPYTAAGRRGFWPVPKRMIKEIYFPRHVSDNPLK